MTAAPAAPDDLPDPPSSRLWWTAPAIGFVLLALVGMFFGGGPQKVDFGTSYDASDRGFRAAYLLLEELRYPVERSRYVTGGQVRWVLSPGPVAAKDAESLNDWVRRGGIALLAVEDAELAQHLGLRVSVKGGPAPRNERERELARMLRPLAVPKGKPRPAVAPDVTTVSAGDVEVTGPPGDRTWGRIEGGPLVTVYRRERGEIWLLHRPDVFSNSNMREADNAVLACRLAEAMLRERPNGRLAFDEYVHGLRDRPSASELLFRQPVLGLTLQVIVLGLLVLWHSAVRFGALRTAPPPARRSKEEFLDAMAELLTRNGDRAAAFRTVRDAVLRKLEESLGLPAGTPLEQTVSELARRRGVNPEPLRELLSADEPPRGRSAGAFLTALEQLESAAHECLQPRRGTR